MNDSRLREILHDAIGDCCFGRDGKIISWLRGPSEVEQHIAEKLEAALAEPTSGPKETSVEKRRCRWEADREGQDQCVLAESHAGMHQYGPVVFVDDSTPAQDGRAAKTLSASDIRLRNLDRLINQPEPNVIVNPDGSCSPASDLRAKLEALRDQYSAMLTGNAANIEGHQPVKDKCARIVLELVVEELTAIIEGKD